MTSMDYYERLLRLSNAAIAVEKGSEGALAAELEELGIAPSVESLYHAVLGRRMEMEVSDGPLAGCELESRAIELLVSPELFVRFSTRAARDFPNLPRVFFAHVPKTAGTWVREVLTADSAVLLSDWTNWEGSSRLDSLERLRYQCEQVVGFEARVVLFSGHVSLGQYLDADLIRLEDRVFALVREPLELMLSLVNFLLDLALADPPQFNHTDRLEWPGLREIYATRESGNLVDPSRMKTLGRELLTSDEFAAAEANPLTRYLSDGRASIAGVISAAELTGVTYLLPHEVGNYLDEISWPARADLAREHLNVSHHWLEREDLTPSDLATVLEGPISRDLQTWTYIQMKRSRQKPLLADGLGT